MSYQLNDILTEIRNIWEEIIGVSIEDDDENFFSLGGNSIQALEITNRINIVFTLNLTILDFFESLTITKLATLIENERI